MYETCLNVESNLNVSIRKAAAVLDISCCKLAKLLIKKAGCLNKDVIRKRLVEYQESGITISYECFRYRITEEERRCFAMFRCDLGISISKLLLVGYLLFFDSIISEISLESDELSFLKNSYNIIKNMLFKSIELYLFDVLEVPG